MRSRTSAHRPSFLACSLVLLAVGPLSAQELPKRPPDRLVASNTGNQERPLIAVSFSLSLPHTERIRLLSPLGQWEVEGGWEWDGPLTDGVYLLSASTSRERVEDALEAIVTSEGIVAALMFDSDLGDAEWLMALESRPWNPVPTVAPVITVAAVDPLYQVAIGLVLVTFRDGTSVEDKVAALGSVGGGAPVGGWPIPQGGEGVYLVRLCQVLDGSLILSQAKELRRDDSVQLAVPWIPGPQGG